MQSDGMGSCRVGIDVGGTFTDICLIDDADRSLAFWKVPSTPVDPSEAMLTGITDALEYYDRQTDDVGYLAHGTTVATNMVLQRRGAKTALLTTGGFRDLLEIGRGRWPKMYDLDADKPAGIVERELCVDVPERMLFDGTVHQPLDEDGLRIIAERLRALDVGAVAVCYLHSYANPAHEERTAELLSELLPGVAVSISSDIWPEQREAERLMTTALNAYLVPQMGNYLNSLSSRLKRGGIAAEPAITASTGGLLPIPTAARKPVLTLLSGPSAGVVGAVEVGRRSGVENLITFDMGGTSTDVALVDRGEVNVVTEKDFDGMTLTVPTVDVVSIGAGGGSIARVDEGGLLKVGPESAGADPGPACYLKGGEHPTVTDAMVVLGYLNEGSLLGGRMRIDLSAAREAIERDVASVLGVDATEAALGILQVARSNIEQAIRVVSVDRGHDPRDFTLVAFGGAGPQHAVALAESLEIRDVIVPPSPGTLCALGLLATDMRTDYSRALRVAAEPDSEAAIKSGFADLDARAQAWFEASGIPPEGRALRRAVDMRYLGQHHQIAVPFTEHLDVETDWDELLEAFRQQHQRLYGHSGDGNAEIVALRVGALGLLPGLPERPAVLEAAAAKDAGRPTSRVIHRQSLPPVDAPVYDRAALTSGQTVSGPCIIEQMDTTTVILDDQTAVIDDFGSIRIRLDGE
jgi:N-methylhydantoinase A